MSTEACIQMFVGALLLIITNLEQAKYSPTRKAQTMLTVQWKSTEQHEGNMDRQVHTARCMKEAR